MASTKVILVGNLGANPELRYTQGQQAVANLRIATTEKWTDKSGQKQEATEWHRVVVWGRQAEIVGQYLTKGRQVYIEGRIRTRQWQDQQGQKRFTTEIVAQNVQMLGGRSERAHRKAQRKPRCRPTRARSATISAADRTTTFRFDDYGAPGQAPLLRTALRWGPPAGGAISMRIRAIRTANR